MTDYGNGLSAMIPTFNLPAAASARFSRAPNLPTYRYCSRRNSNLSSISKPRMTLGLTVPPSLLAIADEVIE
jgi:hypothetical protein